MENTPTIPPLTEMKIPSHQSSYTSSKNMPEYFSNHLQHLDPAIPPAHWYNLRQQWLFCYRCDTLACSPIDDVTDMKIWIIQGDTLKLSKMGRSCINYVTHNKNFQYARKHFEILLDELTKATDWWYTWYIISALT